MRSHYRLWGLVGTATMLVLGLWSAPLWASERPKGFAKFDPAHETVELFAGIQSGQLDVQLIPRDSTDCRLFIGNKTARPLNVRLPEVLAGVPVLGQFGPGLAGPGGGGFAQGNPFGANANQGSPQALGIGGGPGMNNQAGRGGWGNGAMLNVPGAGANRRNGGPFLFSVAPETVGQLRLPCVCLEHGKPTPRPAVPYQLRPLETVTPKAEVQEICRMLGQGELTQQTAQAAAWHLANNRTWTELAHERISWAMGRLSQPQFTAKQLADAKAAVERAVQLAAEHKKAPTTAVSMNR